MKDWDHGCVITVCTLDAHNEGLGSWCVIIVCTLDEYNEGLGSGCVIIVQVLFKQSVNTPNVLLLQSL